LSRPQHDYAALRREYVESDVSIRELARDHGIKSWSTVNAKKNTEDWDAMRASYKAKLAEGEVSTLVQKRLETIAGIHEEILLAIRAATRNYLASVTAPAGQTPEATVSARDLMGMIDKFLLLAGSTPHRTENRNVESHSYTLDGLLADAPPALLNELAGLARERGAGARPVGRGPLVVLEGAG
jgi:transposase-like protein